MSTVAKYSKRAGRRGAHGFLSSISVQRIDDLSLRLGLERLEFARSPDCFCLCSCSFRLSRARQNPSSVGAISGHISSRYRVDRTALCECHQTPTPAACSLPQMRVRTWKTTRGSLALSLASLQERRRVHIDTRVACYAEPGCPSCARFFGVLTSAVSESHAARGLLAVHMSLQ